MAHVTTIIVAGGEGTRLGAPVPKAFVEIAGLSMLEWSLRRLRAAGLEDFVVAVPADWEPRAREQVGDGPVLVEGGVTRMASVARALSAVPDNSRVVVVHDAARPFIPEAVVRRTIHEVVSQSDVLAAAPGLGVSDTIKRVSGTDVDRTVEREDLVAIQTPQVFQREVLEAAHHHATVAHQMGTDDLRLVERLLAANMLAGRIVVTQGSSLGMKITRPDDLVMGAAIAHLLSTEVG